MRYELSVVMTGISGHIKNSRKPGKNDAIRPEENFFYNKFLILVTGLIAIWHRRIQTPQLIRDVIMIGKGGKKCRHE
jgi:hypothetical protein